MRVRPKVKELNETLIKKGLSARGLARVAGIGTVTAFQACNGKVITPPISKKICDALGVDFDEIFTIEPKKAKK